MFLMGVANLNKISKNLIKEGKDKNTPVAIINWATRYNQKVVTGTLENIYDIALKENIKPPSLIVVGDVVNLREKLNFFENKELFGKNILVTRARAQSSTLVEKINDLGGNAIQFPTIKIDEISPNKELEQEIDNIENYSYIIFTSQNAVDIFFKKMYKMNVDLRKLHNAKIVAIGPATANELRIKGIVADIVPPKYVAESIYEVLKDELSESDNILIPRASNARDYLVEKLSEICNVRNIHIYNTVVESNNKGEILKLLDKNNINYITFTSSSTVNNFMKIIGIDNINKLSSTKLISIGPITSKTIESYKLKVHKEADEYTIDGMLDCIKKDINI